MLKLVDAGFRVSALGAIGFGFPAIQSLGLSGV